MKNNGFINLTLNQIFDILEEKYPKMEYDKILTLSLSNINDLISSENIDEVEEHSSELKHCQTRKKRSKRLSKKYKKHYKKEKDESITKTRRRVEEDVTNRSYINKASKSFVPNRKI